MESAQLRPGPTRVLALLLASTAIVAALVPPQLRAHPTTTRLRAERKKRESWDEASPVRASRPIPRHRRLASKGSSRKQSERLEKGEVGSPTRLRVIAGSARGRKLDSPETLLRPMMGKVREALFSTLVSLGVFAAPRRVRALDTFCGSGSVGVEALSRGAAAATFVDLSRDACDVALRNARACAFDDVEAICATAEDALATPALHGGDRRFDLVTLTPPYEEVSYADLADRVAESPLLNDDCVVVFEYPVELGSLPPKLGSRDQLVGLRNRRYGRTVLGFDAYKPTGKVPLDPRPAEFEGFNWLWCVLCWLGEQARERGSTTRLARRGDPPKRSGDDDAGGRSKARRVGAGW